MVTLLVRHQLISKQRHMTATGDRVKHPAGRLQRNPGPPGWQMGPKSNKWFPKMVLCDFGLLVCSVS